MLFFQPGQGAANRPQVIHSFTTYCSVHIIVNGCYVRLGYKRIFANYLRYWCPVQFLWWACQCFCLYVCLSVRKHTLRNSTSSQTSLPQIFVHVTDGCRLDLLWRCCHTLCTSGFLDDVLFAHRPYAGMSVRVQRVTSLRRRVQANALAAS